MFGNQLDSCLYSGPERMKRNILFVLVILVAQLLVFQSVKGFADRPIKLVVPSPAGSPPDMIARILSDKMAVNLGQPVIVDNRQGAGGTIGAKSVRAAEPDGHTLMVGTTSNLLIAPLVYKNAGYDAGTFTPVARVSDSAEVLAVHPSVSARSVSELIALAKTRPGMLNYASAGIGTLPHIEGELLKSRSGIDIRHVPYRGGGQALTGLIAGEVDVLFSTLTQMLPYVRECRLRGLAVTSESRSPLAPDIPTMVESGIDRFVTASVTFIVAPAGTPLAIRQRVNEAVAGALASPEVQQAFLRIGAEARLASPQEVAAFLIQEQQRWSRIIEATRISAD
jgi:tripartite-type tricarboxylate transporter receptor subunit TctC